MIGRIPHLAGVDLPSARGWFTETIVAVGGEGWHPDDKAGDILDGEGNPLFTPLEADYVDDAMSRLREGSRSWPDPDFLYHISSLPKFDIEQIWPGIVIDIGVLPCLRTGYASLAGHDVPNVVVEDGAFYLVEFPELTGPISQHSRFVVSVLDHACFRGHLIDTSSATVDRGSSVEFDDIDALEGVMSTMAVSARP